MIVVMLWLRWDFALIARAVTPLLAVFVLRVNKAVRTAVKEVRTRQSDLLATLQEGLQSIEVIKAFTREDRQEQQLQQAGLQTATAWLQARKASALLAPMVTLAIAVCTGLVLWRGSLLVLSGVMTIGSLSIFWPTWPLFHPGARSSPDDQHHRQGVGRLPTGDGDLRRRHRIERRPAKPHRFGRDRV
jgi:subfamily B ATP-binding cassette protein MsbA